MTTLLIPNVIEKQGQIERSMDIYTRLLQDRVVFLNGEVTNASISPLIAQLLYLRSVDASKPISMYIDTPGGAISSGMALYDTMELLKKEGTIIKTYCVGLAASMGSIFMSSGSKGHRYMLKHSQIMIHQPLGGAQGQTSDVLIRAQQLTNWKKKVTKVLADNSGQPYSKVELDCDRDTYLDAEEAIKYGLADHIL